MYWQLNDCWGVCSWSSIDYYGNYKALQYGARHFNAPVSVSIENTEEYIKLFVLNDLKEKQDVTVTYDIFDFVSGTKQSDKKDVSIDAVKNELVFELDVKSLAKGV